MAVVIEMAIAADGSVGNSSIYKATVRNRARLSYNKTASWLDVQEEAPPEASAVACMEKSLRVQYEAARKMKALRHRNGALNLETIQTKPVFSGDTLMNLEEDRHN